MLSQSSFSPDDQWLGVVYGDLNGGVIQLWSVADRKLAREFKVGGERLSTIAFTPDGRHVLAAGSPGGRVHGWNVADGEPLNLSNIRVDGGIFRMAISQQRVLATANTDKSIGLWDLDTQQSLGKLVGHGASAIGLAFSPDGNATAFGQ